MGSCGDDLKKACYTNFLRWSNKSFSLPRFGQVRCGIFGSLLLFLNWKSKNFTRRSNT